MKEELLHYLFRTKQLGNKFISTSGKQILIIEFGAYNLYDGPDFLYAKVEIDGVQLYGAIEFHIKASDWYKHKHQLDENYKQVILHMVIADDVEVLIENNILDCINISNLIPASSVKNYHFLKTRHSKIPCEKMIQSVSQIYVEKQLETAFVNRLNRKTSEFSSSLSMKNGDFEFALFNSLAYYIGGKANGKKLVDLFAELIKCSLKKLVLNHADFQLVINYLLTNNLNELDSKFVEQKFGITFYNKINFIKSGNYPKGNINVKLNRYLYLMQKTNLLMQFVQNQIGLNELYDTLVVRDNEPIVFDIKFDFPASFVNHILINTLFPAKYVYAETFGSSLNDEIITDFQKIKSEQNSIVDGWRRLNVISDSAYTSQALIEQKNEWCLKKNCLFCSIGNQVLKR